MKIFSAGLLFLASLVMSVPVSFAQQDPSYQKLVGEVETLKEEVLDLQNQLKTVENVEKIKLSAELADAKAQLINAEFDKFDWQLRNSNTKWMWRWTGFFGVIIAVILSMIGVALWFVIKSLIMDGVEKYLKGFKESLDQLDEIKNQLEMLHIENAVSILERFIWYSSEEESYYREQTALIPEESLLQVFDDKTRSMQLRYRAADVLTYRNPSVLVTSLLELMDSILNDDLESNYDIDPWGNQLIRLLGQIHTEASYQGLKNFLNRLLTEGSVHKSLLLTPTVTTLAEVSVELNKGDSVSILRKSILDFRTRIYDEDQDALIKLSEYFDIFKDPEGIKDILRNGLTEEMPGIEIMCLELLEKYDPNFVNDWREQRANVNTETEETS